MKILALALALAAFSLVGRTAASAPIMTPGEQIASRTDVGAAVTAVGADSFANMAKSFDGGVVGYPDMVYETLIGYRPLKLDLFLPPERFKAMGPRPVLIYIHGGGWVGGGPRRSAAYSDWPKVLASIAEHGYVVASVSYRFAGEAPFPAAIQDVKAAIRFLRANADKYDIDRSRFMTMGQSAGGHLAALAAVSCGAAALEPATAITPKAANVELAAPTAKGADAQSDCVQGAVAWFGIYDFTLQPKGGVGGVSPVDLFLHCQNGVCDPAVVKAASPITYVTPQSPPIFLMHGAMDKTAPIAQSYAFEAALKSAGVKTNLIVFPHSDHSWICPTPEETGAVSRDALKQSIDFIDATIGDSASKRP